MKKSGAVFVSIVLVTILLMSSVSFVSANWFTDFFAKIGGGSVTGNIIYGGNHHCDYSFSGTSELSIGSTPCSTYASVSAGCISTPSGYYNVLGCVDNSGQNFLCVTGTCAAPCTDSSWTPSTSNTCSNQTLTQTSNCGHSRLVSGTKNCSVSLPPSPVCVSYNYSSWSACVNGVQTRTLISASPSGCNSSNSILSQACSVETTCTDSDGGLNYYVKGTIIGSFDYQNVSRTDYCLYNNNYTLGEYNCSNFSPGNNFQINSYVCPNGCADGACISTSTSPSLKIIQPNGGEILTEGQVYSIKWEQKNIDPTSISLGYKRCPSCLEWISADVDVSGQASDIKVFNWTVKNLVPAAYNSNLTIYITGYNAASDTWLVNQSSLPFKVVQSTATCTDSDGGLNYYVRGSAYGSEWANVSNFVNSSDYCISSGPKIGKLAEYKCQENQVVSESYDCPNGCSNGACLSTPRVQVCQSTIDKIKNAADFVDNGIGYTNSWNSSYGENNYWLNGTSYAFTAYSASWYTNYNNQYNQITETIRVFNNSNIDLQSMMDDITRYTVCKVESTWVDDKEQRYYLCNWDILNNRQSLDSYSNQNREILWFNDNVLVQISTYTGVPLTEEQVEKIAQTRLNDFINSLTDNQYQYVDWSKFNVDYPLSVQIEKFLGSCASHVSLTMNLPCWSCKIEPTICPPHGFQTKSCVDNCANTPKKEDQISCSPGICSGCYTPKWFESGSGDNKCIPYGFRFKQQTGWTLQDVFVNNTDSEGLTVEQAQRNPGDINLTVYPNNTAVLSLEIKQGIWKDIYLEIGKSYDWKNLTGVYDQDKLDYTVYVDKIYFDSSNYLNSFITVSFTMTGYMNQQSAQTINAYCDIDGQIKEQKTQAWGECQNNYECDSNICSYGQCADIKGMFAQVNAFKGIFVKVVCKLAHFYNLDDYNTCVYSYLGDGSSSNSVKKTN